MKTYIAFNIDGGYTELQTIHGESEIVENCQVLVVEEANTIEEFIELVKQKWQEFDIGQIEVREISNKGEYFDLSEEN